MLVVAVTAVWTAAAGWAWAAVEDSVRGKEAVVMG